MISISLRLKLAFYLCFLSSLIVSAQGNDCGSAPNLPINTSCVPQGFNNNEDGTAPEFVASCASGGTSYEDAWYTVIGTGNTITINVTGTNRDYTLAAWSGCGTGQLACTNQVSGVNGSISFPTSAGVTYYVQIQRRSGNNAQNLTGNICAFDPLYVPPSACADMTINTTTFSQTGLTTCGFGDDYSSSNACGSLYMNGDDIVIAYTPTTSECVSFTLSNTGTWVGIFLTDDCPDAGGVNCLASNTNSGGNPSISGFNVIAGTTYYLTVSTYPSPQCTPFDISIAACPPPPPNDECTNAISVPVTPQGGSCSSTAGYITNATTSSQANTCGGTADDDVWYSFVATSNDVQIDLTGISGSTSDMYFSVYAGTCGAIGAPLLCSDPNSGQVSGLTIGNTYFIRIYSWTSTGGQNVNFNLCVGEIGPCGIASSTEDYCPYAATLTQGPGSWTSTTYDYYTADLPGNINSVFCGSIENNSWYQFTALSTTEVFNITNVSSCTNGWGVQMQVYDVTTNASGCCTNFTSMSNCYNPANTTLGTVTATGLTIGNTYILMVDGNAGDNCAFTISGWTATGIILPVELIDLGAISREIENIIHWKTASEQNNDFFEIQRSYDGINFVTIGTEQGKGTTNEEHSYYFSDDDVRNGVVYYRLKQHDFDGKTQTSETISLNRNYLKKGISSIYPNPADQNVTVELSTSELNGKIILELKGMDGKTIRFDEIENYSDVILHSLNIESLAKGMYILHLYDQNGFSQTKRLTKK